MQTLLKTLLISLSTFARPPKGPVPIAIMDSGPYLPFNDIGELRLYVLGSSVTVLLFFLLWIAKEINEYRKKKMDQTENKLDFVVESIHRLEERFKAMEEKVKLNRIDPETLKGLIQGQIRDEIEFLESYAKRHQP